MCEPRLVTEEPVGHHARRSYRPVVNLAGTGSSLMGRVLRVRLDVKFGNCLDVWLDIIDVELSS
eukprot:5144181-Pyramimonas_sp.AAC.1